MARVEGGVIADGLRCPVDDCCTLFATRILVVSVPPERNGQKAGARVTIENEDELAAAVKHHIIAAHGAQILQSLFQEPDGAATHPAQATADEAGPED